MSKILLRISKLLIVLFCVNTGIYSQGVAVGSRIDLTAKLQLNSGAGQFAQVFIPDFFAIQSNDEFLLVFHLHSASWAAEDQVYKSNTNAVLFNIHLGGFSSSYQNYFVDQSKFQAILDTVISVLKTHAIMTNPQIKNVIVTSFSAGYAGVREIFKTASYYDQIDALNLADGLHCSSNQPTMVTQMQDFVKYARDARDLKKIMLLTHSSIPTPGYQSTTQTADYLINEIGSVRVPFTANDEIGTQYSRCDTGYFHIKGYLGQTASDHLKHLYAMNIMLEYAVNLLDTLYTGINYTPIKNNKIFLYPNYPNPFNGSTIIEYYLPENDIVKIDLFDCTGQKIEQLLNNSQTAGYHQINWSPVNYSSGIYFCQILTNNHIQTRQMILLR